ncbi:MAG: ABC transporter permease [Caldilinea sp.]
MSSTETQFKESGSLPQAKRSRSVRQLLRTVNQVPEARLMLAVLIIAALLAFSSDAFLSPFNIVSVLMSFSFIAIAALGQLLVIITGGIDLSAGSVIGLAGMLAAFVIAAGYHPALWTRAISPNIRSCRRRRAAAGSSAPAAMCEGLDDERPVPRPGARRSNRQGCTCRDQQQPMFKEHEDAARSITA